MLVISGFGYLSGWLKTRRGLRTGDTRKIFHFAIFTTAAVLSLTLGVGGVNVLGGLMAVFVITVVIIGEGNIFYEGLARETDRPRRSLHVLLPFAATAAGGITSVLLFGPWATVGFVASGWGDAVAEPVGLRFGKHPYRVPTIGGVTCHRTLEGSAAVFVAAFAGVAALLLWTGLGRDTTAGFALLAAACVAAASTAVEAVSHHGLDNLTLPVAASAVAWAML